MQLNLTSQQETGLRTLLEAAQRTEFYGPWLEAIATPLSRCLDLLPHVEHRHFDDNREAFRNPRGGRAPQPEFRYPLQPAPKILMLLPGFRRSASFRNVFDLNGAGTAGMNADTLAAPVNVLRSMAPMAGPQRYPVIVFTGVLHGTLTAADRELFWKSFRVPVFEQLLGLGNELVAEECEAHDGLHVREDQNIIELRSGELVYTPLEAVTYTVLRIASGCTVRPERALCPCGRAGLRLKDIAPIAKARGAAVW
ncbi:MAG: hypothetical protein ABJF23_01870 [Bryobacteraceae bacterium]